MPSWGEILAEVGRTLTPEGHPDVDRVRRKYLTKLHAHTGRSTIIYGANFFNVNSPVVQVGLQDMQGMMEAFRGLPGPDLDLILHSPGGQAEATDRLVRYMRSKFDHVRVIVPLAAMSAATMWAMAADEIVLGKHSQLGPIDPQVTFNGNTVPAGALIDQFVEAQEQCSADPRKVTGWLPTLQQYPPGLLNVCESATALSKKLVGEWLERYMLAGQKNASEVAQGVATWLADDKEHLSHGRAITRDELRAKGLTGIVDLETDPTLQDLVLSVHHAVLITFNNPVAKLIENHLGRAYVHHVQTQVVQVPPQGALTPQIPPAGHVTVT